MSRQQTDAEAKRLANAAARCALLGVSLHRIEGDFVPELFILTRWQMTLQFTRLEDVEQWLDLLNAESLDCLTEEALCEIYQITPDIAAEWRARRHGPGFVRSGCSYLYPRAGVAEDLSTYAARS